MSHGRQAVEPASTVGDDLALQGQGKSRSEPIGDGAENRDIPFAELLPIR